jgi:hypothetical protein
MSAVSPKDIIDALEKIETDLENKLNELRRKFIDDIGVENDAELLLVYKIFEFLKENI